MTCPACQSIDVTIRARSEVCNACGSTRRIGGRPKSKKLSRVEGASRLFGAATLDGEPQLRVAVSVDNDGSPLFLIGVGERKGWYTPARVRQLVAVLQSRLDRIPT